MLRPQPKISCIAPDPYGGKQKRGDPSLRCNYSGRGWQMVGGAVGTIRTHGGNEGFRCELLACQQGGFAAAVTSNSDSGAAVVGAVLQAIAPAYGWSGSVTSPQLQLEPGQEAINQLTGDYELRPGFQLTINRASTGLTLTVQGQPPPVFVLKQNGADLRALRIRS